MKLFCGSNVGFVRHTKYIVYKLKKQSLIEELLTQHPRFRLNYVDLKYEMTTTYISLYYKQNNLETDN